MVEAQVLQLPGQFLLERCGLPTQFLDAPFQFRRARGLAGCATRACDRAADAPHDP